MGFRFHNLHLLYRSCISKLSHVNKDFHPNPMIQTLNSHLQDPSLTLSDRPIYKVSRRWHMGHFDHDRGIDQHHQHHLPDKDGENIFRLGLAADIFLASGKALTGYLSGSTAIIADAAHSVSDVIQSWGEQALRTLLSEKNWEPSLKSGFFHVLSGVALWSFKAAKAPKDKEHPYGHGKFETLGALGISSMLLITAGGIAWHALDLLLGVLSSHPEIFDQPLRHEHVDGHHHRGHHHGIDMDHPILALNMTIVSICVKEGLYWITKQAGERQGSGLMKANAWHHRADAISSVVALIGVGGSILGVKFLDPLAGLIVSGMILKAGLESGYQSVLELVDAATPAEQLEPIKQTILQTEGVKGCHRMRGRRAGSSLYLDVHIEVDPLCSVSAAHYIGEKVRHRIHKSHPEVAEVFIHIDPAISQISPSVANQQESMKGTMYQNRNIPAVDKDFEAVVSDVILAKFPEIMVVERITRHLLQGKVLLQIEVSMPPEMLIREAMELAVEAEKEIQKAASNIIHVSIQLRLGHPMPQLNHE